jgi:CHAT domain
MVAPYEPGLIPTPPDHATEDDDGYLSASEIAALKLDADWVILSACNTAAGAATSAEALSGFARAFIYAEARALLVSHWEVYSDATVKLITASVREMARDPKVGRSEALRDSMLALIVYGANRPGRAAACAIAMLIEPDGDGLDAHRPRFLIALQEQLEYQPHGLGLDQIDGEFLNAAAASLDFDRRIAERRLGTVPIVLSCVPLHGTQHVLGISLDWYSSHSVMTCRIITCAGSSPSPG